MYHIRLTNPSTYVTQRCQICAQCPNMDLPKIVWSTTPKYEITQILTTFWVTRGTCEASATMDVVVIWPLWLSLGVAAWLIGGNQCALTSAALGMRYTWLTLSLLTEALSHYVSLHGSHWELVLSKVTKTGLVETLHSNMLLIMISMICTQLFASHTLNYYFPEYDRVWFRDIPLGVSESLPFNPLCQFHLWLESMGVTGLNQFIFLGKISFFISCHGNFKCDM